MANDGSGLNQQPMYTTSERVSTDSLAILGAPPPPPPSLQYHPQQHHHQRRQQQQQYQQQQHHLFQQQQQQQQQLQQSDTLPSIRSSMRLPSTVHLDQQHNNRNHSSTVSAQQHQQLLVGGGSGAGVAGNPGSAPLRQGPQILPLPFQQQRGGSVPGNLSPLGIGGSAMFGVGARAGSQAPPTMSSPFMGGTIGGGGGRGNPVVLDLTSLGQQQCPVPSPTTWPPGIPGYAAMPPMQNTAPSPSSPSWRASQPLPHQASGTTFLGGAGTRSTNSGGWAQQAQGGGSVQRGGGGRNGGGGTGSGLVVGAGVGQNLHPTAVRGGGQQTPFSLVGGGIGLPQALLQRAHSPRQHQQQQQQLHQQQQLQQQQQQQQQQQWTVESLTKAFVRPMAGGDSWSTNAAGLSVAAQQAAAFRSNAITPSGWQASPPTGQTRSTSHQSSAPGPAPMAMGMLQGASLGVQARQSDVGGGETGRAGAGGRAGGVSLQQQQLLGGSEMGRIGAGGTQKDFGGKQQQQQGAMMIAVGGGVSNPRGWNQLRSTIPLFQEMFNNQQQQQLRQVGSTSPLPSATKAPTFAAPRLTPIAPMLPKHHQLHAMPPPPALPTLILPSSSLSPLSSSKGESASASGSNNIEGRRVSGGRNAAGKLDGSSSKSGGGGGEGGSKVQGRRGPPTKLLSTLHDMLIAGNPQIWWERETGSVVIEDPQLFEAETMPRYFPEPKISAFLRQLSFYGFKKPAKNARDQSRFQHPECRWKDVSVVKTLLTKKVYDQKRLENAIRNTAAGTGATSPQQGNSGSNNISSANDNSNGNNSKGDTVESCLEGGVVGGRGGGGEGAAEGVYNGTQMVVVSGMPVSCGSSGAVRGGRRRKRAQEEVVERTELEVATEAAVVRARGMGREARKELRSSLSRAQMGRWQLEQMAQLMMQVMRLNAKLVQGLKECRARGGPPRIRRCKVKSPGLAKMRSERARLKRRVRQLEEEVEARGMAPVSFSLYDLP